MTEKTKIIFLRFVFWFGAIADLLLFLEMLLIIFFGTSVSWPIGTDAAYKFTLRGEAAIMLGWTILLIWAQRKPIERKEILLFTSIMIVVGLLLNVSMILHPYQLTCIFTMTIFFVAYLVASDLKKKQDKEE